MIPSIGRIVHYAPRKGAVVPAIITAVHDENCVNLRVFVEDTSVSKYHSSVKRSRGVTSTEPVEESCWAFPPHVEQPKQLSEDTKPAGADTEG
jgi:hypothetical protein